MKLTKWRPSKDTLFIWATGCMIHSVLFGHPRVLAVGCIAGFAHSLMEDK